MKYSKYNELNYIKEVYDNKIGNPRWQSDLRLLAIYLKKTQGLKPKPLKEALYDWCETTDGIKDDFNRMLHFQIVNAAVASASKKNACLVQIDNTIVCQHELDYIDSYSGEEYNYEIKKLMFTFLVLSKINGEAYSQRTGGEVASGTSFKGGVRKYNQLKKMANLPSKLDINSDIIHEMKLQGLITVKHLGLIYLNFMKDIKTIECANPKKKIEIKTFEDIGWYYDYYYDKKSKNKKSKMKLCGNGAKDKTRGCNRPFKQIATNEVYCKDCRGYQPIEHKTIKCVNCGYEVKVAATNNTKTRCGDCYSEHRKEKNKESVRKFRDKSNV